MWCYGRVLEDVLLWEGVSLCPYLSLRVDHQWPTIAPEQHNTVLDGEGIWVMVVEWSGDGMLKELISWLVGWLEGAN